MRNVHSPDRGLGCRRSARSPSRWRSRARLTRTPSSSPTRTTSSASAPTRLSSSCRTSPTRSTTRRSAASQRLASFDATGSAHDRAAQGLPTRSPGRTARPPASTSCRPTRTSRSPARRAARTPPVTRARASTRTPRTSSSYVYAKPKSNVSLNLTASDLFDIYTCGKTDWSDFGKPAGHIEAKVPQAGSGTRIVLPRVDRRDRDPAPGRPSPSPTRLQRQRGPGARPERRSIGKPERDRPVLVRPLQDPAQERSRRSSGTPPTRARRST